jgi:hypothetical protein
MIEKVVDEAASLDEKPTSIIRGSRCIARSRRLPGQRGNAARARPL